MTRKLLIDAGKACAAYRDRVLHGLPCRRIQVDEIWSFIYAKEKNVLPARTRSWFRHGGSGIAPA